MIIEKITENILMKKFKKIKKIINILEKENSNLEEILNPKSIHAAAEDAMSQINAQRVANGTEKSGGKYDCEINITGKNINSFQTLEISSRVKHVIIFIFFCKFSC